MNEPSDIGNVGPEVVTDWYDGPLRSFARVTFKDGTRPMVQVRTTLAWTDGPDTLVRFDANELRAMLDVTEGKPIEDASGEPVCTNGTTHDGSCPPCGCDP